jgi:hypothetical protein
MGGELLAFTQHLETITCWAHEGCGVVFAVPRTLLSSLREHKGTLHCPKGHRLGFGDSEADKLRVRLEQEERRTERQRKEKEWAQQDAAKAKRSASAYKGKLTATKNRVGHGVCPCCNRTFQQLARHMKCKHPNYATEEV